MGVTEEETIATMEKFSPIWQIGKATMGDSFPLDGQDFLELVRGGIGSIPVIGEMANCIFGIFWKKLFPVEDPYLRKVDFEKRMKKLVEDMEKMMDKKIDQEIVNFCNLKFEALCSAGFGFSEIEYIYQKEKNEEGKPASDAVKSYMAANHVSFRNLLLECLIFFGREDKIKLLGKLYLQTSLMYIAFLRDTHFYGIEWGLPEKYVYGVDHIKSMKEKIHETITLTHEHFSKFFNALNPKRDYSMESQCMIINDKGMSYYGYPPTIFKCDFRALTAEMTYTDLTIYNKKQIWLQQTNSKGQVRKQSSGSDRPDFSEYESGSYLYRLPVSNRIYTAEFSNMPVMRGFFGSAEDESSINSVTGSPGMASGQSDGLFYDCFYFDEPKNLLFRVWANIDPSAKLEFVIRQIPKGNEINHPDESRTIATRSDSEVIEYTKVFDSASGPIAVFQSQQYSFEAGSVYFEVKVLGGENRSLYTLDIIDTPISN